MLVSGRVSCFYPPSQPGTIGTWVTSLTHSSTEGTNIENSCFDPKICWIFMMFLKKQRLVGDFSGFHQPWKFWTQGVFQISPTSWWFFPTHHLKNMLVKLDYFPRVRGENSKNIWVATTQPRICPKKTRLGVLEVQWFFSGWYLPRKRTNVNQP